ncbi:16S rRNA (guanine(527)-N(7))-methyltransferase RsmG [Hydrococcus rivularis NIES-593]|uniref:Ribosomal RNA small subunit methyltransferase G n=1 Tax=Hydrococcus rivularis NIES-593 TaxID=1921803 RepID=A0A1U7HNV5_9CYAN|nr:16S rRNA (guanine(527)-N(7))-methyltransferase RsmG [Hydrococcus rivularis]OKH25195.1 16S rRNA (guanine(527)-N(7))-methyltransferase RsmG [Hydrococcus rivularis NIES-593]
MIDRIQQLPVLGEVWQTTLGWQPNKKQQEQFQKLYEEIIIGNRQFNLTRITEPREFWEKHLWDSLAGLSGLEIANELEAGQPLYVIDIGTGAGFPGIPIAIALPFWTVTLLDSTRKKMFFLSGLIAKLDLKNIQTLIGRAEEIGQNPLHRQAYDLALLRAVGEATVCAEYALPLLKIGGLAILYRGHWDRKDNLSLQFAAEKLGGKIERVTEFVTPLSQSIRHCIYLRKMSPTPEQFPRAVGIPVQKPL